MICDLCWFEQLTVAKDVEDSKVNGQATHVLAAVIQNYLARKKGVL